MHVRCGLCGCLLCVRGFVVCASSRRDLDHRLWLGRHGGWRSAIDTCPDTCVGARCVILRIRLPYCALSQHFQSQCQPPPRLHTWTAACSLCTPRLKIICSVCLGVCEALAHCQEGSRRGRYASLAPINDQSRIHVSHLRHPRLDLQLQTLVCRTACPTALRCGLLSTMSSRSLPAVRHPPSE